MFRIFVEARTLSRLRPPRSVDSLLHTLHPRLRRQLEQAGAGEVSPQWWNLLKSVDAAFRAADADKALFEESLAALTGLLRRGALGRRGIARATAPRRRQTT